LHWSDRWLIQLTLLVFYHWLLELCPQHGLLSIYSADHGSRYIRDAVPIWLSAFPPFSSSVSKLGHLPSFQPDPGLKPWTHHHCNPACLFPHWTIPVSREETLTVREKFRAVSWRQPNFLSKPGMSRYLLLARKSERGVEWVEEDVAKLEELCAKISASRSRSPKK